MVRPPKPQDIKSSIIRTESPKHQLKSINSIKPSDIDDRYRTEVPNNIKSRERKRLKHPHHENLIPPTPPRKMSKENVKSASFTPSARLQKPSRIPKTISHPTPNKASLQLAVPQTKSATNKDTYKVLSSVEGPKSRMKTRRPLPPKEKTPMQAKSEPSNRLSKIPEAKKHRHTNKNEDKSPLASPEKVPKGEGKTRIPSRIGRRSRKLSPPNVVLDKDTAMELAVRRKLLKEAYKAQELGYKKPSTDSLKTHYRAMTEKDKVVEKSTKMGLGNMSPRQRMLAHRKAIKGKGKGDQVKAKEQTKAKPRVNSMTTGEDITLDSLRVDSSESSPVIPVREIKHNDSFVISARKLQNSQRSPRGKSQNPETIKLFKRGTGGRAKGKPTSSQLKSCLKKNWDGKPSENFGQSFKSSPVQSVMLGSKRPMKK